MTRPYAPSLRTARPADTLSGLADGMTVGLGGWASRRRPQVMLKELQRHRADRLTIVSMAGDGLDELCATGKVAGVVLGLAPHPTGRFEAARLADRLTRFVDEVELVDEWVLRWALYSAGLGLPSMCPVSDPVGDGLQRQVTALHLDAALVRMDRGDERGNTQLLDGDLFLDDLLVSACRPGMRIIECDQLVPSDRLMDVGGLHTFRIRREAIDHVASPADATERPAARPGTYWAPPTLVGAGSPALTPTEP